MQAFRSYLGTRQPKLLGHIEVFFFSIASHIMQSQNDLPTTYICQTETGWVQGLILIRRCLKKLPTTRLPRLRSALLPTRRPASLETDALLVCDRTRRPSSKNELRDLAKSHLWVGSLVYAFRLGSWGPPDWLSFLSRLLGCDVRTDQFLLPLAVIHLNSYRKRASFHACESLLQNNNDKTKHTSNSNCGSAFESGASGLPYYCASMCVRSWCNWRASLWIPNQEK